MYRRTELRQLLPTLGVTPPDSVLDVGCGNGQFARSLAAEGYDVMGLDVDPIQIAQAAQAARQEGLNVRFVHRDAMDIGDLGPFDSILMRYYFCMLSERTWQRQLELAKNILKPNGVMIIEDGALDRLIETGQRLGLCPAWQSDNMAALQVDQP